MFGYGGKYSAERLEHVGKDGDVKAMIAATKAVTEEHGAEHEAHHEPGSVEEAEATQKGEAEVEKEIK
jgi:hypothetical protein